MRYDYFSKRFTFLEKNSRKVLKVFSVSHIIAGREYIKTMYKIFPRSESRVMGQVKCLIKE